MASVKKKSRHRAEARPATPAPVIQPGFWEAQALPWLNARALRLALILVAIATLRLLAAYPENGITFDEPGHMACGLQLLAEHVYRYESQHPPLARAMSALGPYLEGARPMHIANQDQEGVALMYRDSHVLRTLISMRLGILPFFFLACLVVYLWSARSFGKPVAVMATGLFTLLPPVLAHAGLATTDMPVAACLGLTFLCMIRWVEQPTFARSLGFGAATGLMVLSKFTALGFFPAGAALALLAYLATQRPDFDTVLDQIQRRAVPFAIAVATGALVIWAGYLFSFGKVPGWNIPLPAPEVFDGIRVALRHNDRGHMAYLFGHLSQTGWWYYFPVVLGVKTPIAFLLLLAGGAWLCWSRRRETVHWLPWAFSLGILIPAMMGNVNIGVRHILPVYIGFSIAAALALERLLLWSQTRQWTLAVAGVLVLWLLGTGLLNHPDYLAYFNEFAGSHPENILVDSDLDWGQDTVRLARWQRETGVNTIHFVTMNLGAERLQAWPGVQGVQAINPLSPTEGWTVVSPTILIFNEYGMNHRYPNLKPWFLYIPESGKVGSLILYYVPPGSLPRKS